MLGVPNPNLTRIDQVRPFAQRKAAIIVHNHTACVRQRAGIDGLGEYVPAGRGSQQYSATLGFNGTLIHYCGIYTQLILKNGLGYPYTHQAVTVEGQHRLFAGGQCYRPQLSANQPFVSDGFTQQPYRTT